MAEEGLSVCFCFRYKNDVKTNIGWSGCFVYWHLISNPALLVLKLAGRTEHAFWYKWQWLIVVISCSQERNKFKYGNVWIQYNVLSILLITSSWLCFWKLVLAILLNCSSSHSVQQAYLNLHASYQVIRLNIVRPWTMERSDTRNYVRSGWEIPKFGQ